MKFTAQELWMLTREYKEKRSKEPQKKETPEYVKPPEISREEWHEIMMETVRDRGYF